MTEPTRSEPSHHRLGPTDPDFPSWLLGVGVGLMPVHRRGWGLALQAELASIDSYSDRRAFALSAVKGVLSARVVLVRLLLAAPLIISAFVALTRAVATRSTSCVVLVAVVVALILLASCAGLSYTRLGPVAPTVGARLLRGILFILLDVWLIKLGNLIGRHPDSLDLVGAMLAVVTTMAYCLVALTVTSLSAAVNDIATVAAGMAGVVGATIWWCVFVASPTVRLHPKTGVAAVGVAALFGIVNAIRGSARSSSLAPRGIFTATLCAVNASCLVIFMAAVTTYQLRPSLVPRISHIPFGGLSPTDLVETDRIEAVDPYIVYLLIGATASVLLLLLSLPRTRLSSMRVASSPA